MNVRQLKWVEIKKLIIRFMGMFIISGILILGYNYFFGTSEIDFASAFYLAVGVSFGMTFANLFAKKGIK